MSNFTGDGGSFSSGNTGEEEQVQHQNLSHGSNSGPTITTSRDSTSQQPPIKKKRNLPGNPDPSAEVIALSPTTLMATNRFVCEICNKGFQRDQNLQLHRRGHNLPWKLRQRTSSEIRKRVYICPVTTCVHHNPTRALGDLTGIKKHYCRKHGEKKWKCDRCSKKYAVQSDWKAHMKTCGTKEYKCDCGTIFSRRDSFITHRAFCDALTEENSKVNQGIMVTPAGNLQGHVSEIMSSISMNNNTTPNPSFGISDFNHNDKNPHKSLSQNLMSMPLKSLNMEGGMLSGSSNMLFGPRSASSTGFEALMDSKNGPQMAGSAHTSATALLQKAAQMGATASTNVGSPMIQGNFAAGMVGLDHLSGMRSYGVNDGGVANQFMRKELQDMSAQFFHSSAATSDMNLYSSVALGPFMASDQDHGFLKNIEKQSNNSSTLLHSRNVHLGMGTSTTAFGDGSSGDMTTVDFLGVGGTRPVNLHEQQQQGLGFEGVSEQRLHGLQQLQQHLSHGQAEIGKSMWDV